MNLSGFEDTKNLADSIQEDTKGEVIHNITGSNNVNVPVDDDLADYNKGVEVMTNIGNYHVINEATKSGSYRPDIEPEEHPWIGDIREDQAKERLAETEKGLEQDKEYYKKEAEEEEESKRKDEEAESARHRVLKQRAELEKAEKEKKSKENKYGRRAEDI